MNFFVFDNLLEASKAFLVESVRIAESQKIKFTIVGGWSPYLRNSQPISHPGTRDVDILFEGATEEGALKTVIRAFLDEGYRVSAKHEFQLLKLIRVGTREFVFNVDLLHPLETTVKGIDLMVDHIDLDVPEYHDQMQNRFGKSIALPCSDFVFENDIVNERVAAKCVRTGREVSQSVPLINEVGVFITKFQSVKSPKRPRDAFDIYVSLTQSRDPDLVIDGIKKVRRRYNGIDELALEFERFVREEDLFSNHVRGYLPASHALTDIRGPILELLAKTNLS